MTQGYYERRLPHWQAEGAAIFLTWRLHGSLPKEVTFSTSTETSGQKFAEVDKILAQGAVGPHWLEEDRIAQVVYDAVVYGQDQLHLYDLCAWVIMLNHLHLLINPQADLARITQSIKGYTARQANILLNRTGLPFWQQESYDRWVRERAGREKVVRYIENNPVAAGLAKTPDAWRWSSAWTGLEAYPTNTNANTNPNI
jgi:REP element-mobilizing transposase RayT